MDIDEIQNNIEIVKRLEDFNYKMNYTHNSCLKAGNDLTHSIIQFSDLIGEEKETEDKILQRLSEIIDKAIKYRRMLIGNSTQE